MRILLVEDDPMIGEAIVDALHGEGHAVDWIEDGNAALLAIKATAFSLLVLDLGLPGKDGIEVLREIRSQGETLPVLITTARDSVDARVNGLDAGADDYLVKPFDLDELLARIRALLRRSAGRAEPEIRRGRLLIRPQTHEVELDGRSLAFTAKEYALLLALADRPGIVLSRAQLEDRLYNWNSTLGSNAIEVHIHHLRRKLGDGSIRTIHGIGYRLET